MFSNLLCFPSLRFLNLHIFFDYEKIPSNIKIIDFINTLFSLFLELLSIHESYKHTNLFVFIIFIFTLGQWVIIYILYSILVRNNSQFLNESNILSFIPIIKILSLNIITSFSMIIKVYCLHLLVLFKHV